MDDCQVPVSQDKDKLRTTTDCEPPVCCHEDQGVDGDIRRDVDDVLDCPAPGQTEGPEHEDVVTRRGRDADLSSEEHFNILGLFFAPSQFPASAASEAWVIPIKFWTIICISGTIN